MKQCSQNENHWYSNHLSYCPWCKITNETGKDPFPSSTGSQTPIGKQISVTPASEQRRETPAAKFKDPVFKETKPQSYDPTPFPNPKPPQKNNARFYLIAFVGVIVFLLAFIGSGMMSGNTFSSNNPQDASSGVPSTSIISTASNSSISGVEAVNVTEQQLPLDADFYASPTSGKASFTVKFTDNSTGSPTSWSWNFGDRTTSTNRNPTHTYSTAGTYTVEETVTNEAGNSTETKIGYIIVKASDEPTNKPSASPQETSTPPNKVTPSTSEAPVNVVTPKNTVTPSKDSGKDSTGGNKDENTGGNTGGIGGGTGDDVDGDAGEDPAGDATDNNGNTGEDAGGDTTGDNGGGAGSDTDDSTGDTGGETGGDSSGNAGDSTGDNGGDGSDNTGDGSGDAGGSTDGETGGDAGNSGENAADGNPGDGSGGDAGEGTTGDTSSSSGDSGVDSGEDTGGDTSGDTGGATL